MKQLELYTHKLLKGVRNMPHSMHAYWRKSWWHKLVSIFVILLVVSIGTMYGIARWYIHTESNKPLTLGVSFIPAYAESLGLNAEDTLNALIDQAGVRHFRLVSYWDEIEPQSGQYDFSSLDWQFQQINKVHGTVMLSVGLRQPRWPECHVPSWAANEPENVWEPQLEQFMTAVVNHYKDNPALQSYQVENEYFLTAFGTCTNFDRNRLISEYNLVKKLDPKHPAIVTRSNNAIGTPIGQPRPDEFGISIYKRIWSPPIGRYFEYPIPAWYYAFLAGVQKIFTGKDMIVHELQAEAWTPDGKSIPETSLTEQAKSMDAPRLQSRFRYGEATGMKTIYLWGAEYWYYRLVVLHDPSLWNVAKQNFSTRQ